jgi:hypothetical protein
MLNARENVTVCSKSALHGFPFMTKRVVALEPVSVKGGSGCSVDSPSLILPLPSADAEPMRSNEINRSGITTAVLASFVALSVGGHSHGEQDHLAIGWTAIPKWNLSE